MELGADDYVTKPFSPPEVTLRVHATLRRLHLGSRDDQPVSFGDAEVILEEPNRTILVRGQPVALTTTRMAAAHHPGRVPGRVFSRYELINRTRGYEFEGYERTVYSHVRNLRHKLETDQHQPRIVQTVVGAGYRFGLRRDQKRATPPTA